MIVQINHISQQTFGRTIARKQYIVFHCFFHYPNNDQHIDNVYLTHVNYNVFVEIHEESNTAIKNISLIALHPNLVFFQISMDQDDIITPIPYIIIYLSNNPIVNFPEYNRHVIVENICTSILLNNYILARRG
jgi:hypothetical protein